MKILLLSAFGMIVAMSVAAPPMPPGLEGELQKLKQIADERAKLFNEFFGAGESVVREDAAEGEAAVATRRPATGLRMSGLGKASLQPSTGLHSGASGLTPEAEWRRMFPHKPGYSR